MEENFWFILFIIYNMENIYLSPRFDKASSDCWGRKSEFNNRKIKSLLIFTFIDKWSYSIGANIMNNDTFQSLKPE